MKMILSLLVLLASLAMSQACDTYCAYSAVKDKTVGPAGSVDKTAWFFDKGLFPPSVFLTQDGQCGLQVSTHCDGLTITGVVYSPNNPSTGWFINIQSTRVSTSQPYLELNPSAYLANGGTIDPTKWSHYSLKSGALTGFGDYKDTMVILTESMHPLQVGYGANGKNYNFGLSAWFDITVNGVTYMTDINVDLKCKDVICSPHFNVSNAIDGYSLTYRSAINGIETKYVFVDPTGIFLEDQALTSAVIAGQIRRMDQSSSEICSIAAIFNRNPNYNMPHKELPASSYKESGGPIDTASWRYYTLVSASIDCPSGNRTDFKTYEGMDLQVGYGANDKNFQFGASGWFEFNITNNGVVIDHGIIDINVNLICGPLSPTPSPTYRPTSSPITSTGTASGHNSGTGTATGTATGDNSATGTASGTATGDNSATGTATGTATGDNSATGTASGAATGDNSATGTASGTATGDNSASGSATGTAATGETVTGTATDGDNTASGSATGTATVSGSATVTGDTVTATGSASASGTATGTATGDNSDTGDNSATGTATGDSSATGTATGDNSATGTATGDNTATTGTAATDGNQVSTSGNTVTCPPNPFIAKQAIADQYGGYSYFAFIFNTTDGVQYRFNFINDVGTFRIYEDGSARLSGSLTPLASNPDDNLFVFNFDVEINFGAGTTPEVYHRELKEEAYVPVGPVDPTTWQFYSLVTSSLTPIGVQYALTIVPYMDMELQVGAGANGKNVNNGASGWYYFYLIDVANENNLVASGVMDINVDLVCDTSSASSTSASSSGTGDAGSTSATGSAISGGEVVTPTNPAVTPTTGATTASASTVTISVLVFIAAFIMNL